MQLHIAEVQSRSSRLIDLLTELWEQSVRLTHGFLTEEQISCIKQYVPKAIEGVERLFIASDVADVPLALMGIQGNRLEMLFLRPHVRGQGLGRKMLRLAVEQGVTELTVNEQNPQACGFYEHLGFETYKRTELDEHGQPFALLYMRLADRKSLFGDEA